MPGLMLNRSIQAFLKPKKLMLKLCEIGAPDWITLNQNTHIETKLLMQRTSPTRERVKCPRPSPAPAWQTIKAFMPDQSVSKRTKPLCANLFQWSQSIEWIRAPQTVWQFRGHGFLDAITICHKPSFHIADHSADLVW